jgi:hypothetical protein
MKIRIIAAAGLAALTVVLLISQTVSCLRAQKKCQSGRKSPDMCDREPTVIEACANEAICFTRAFQRLHESIPSILGGRDPWPPQPLPF